MSAPRRRPEANRNYFTAPAKLPDELSAVSLRLGWSLGRTGRAQVRATIGSCLSMGDLRAALLAVLAADPCLAESAQTRRSAWALVESAAGGAGVAGEPA